MGRKLLIAAAALVAACTPALAQGQSTATITATDPYAWSPGTVTLTAPGTVTFQYPTGASGHNVSWEGTPPDCDAGIPGPDVYGRPGWKGACRFTEPGTYRFQCGVHAGKMTGTVVVLAAPTPTPTPTPTETAAPEPTTAPIPLPAPPPAGTVITVAPAQKGTAIKGTVAPATRAEIIVTLGGAKVGHTFANAPTFTVKLNATARRALRRHTLRLKVTVATETTKRTFIVRLRK